MVSEGSVEDEWFYATATPLPDGRVFIAGGYNDSLHTTDQTWIYLPTDGANTKLSFRTAPSYDALAIRRRRWLCNMFPRPFQPIVERVAAHSQPVSRRRMTSQSGPLLFVNR
jgi:hypothetical protein